MVNDKDDLDIIRESVLLLQPYQERVDEIRARWLCSCGRCLARSGILKTRVI